MAITDRWVKADGKTRTALYGKGLRYRVQLRGHPAKSFAAKGEAERYEARTKRQPKRAPGLVSTSRLVQMWLDGKRGLSAPGYAVCVAAAGRVEEQFGHLDPREILPHDIQAWVAGMTVQPKGGDERPASAATRAKAMQCLSGAMDIAVSLEVIDRNPCKAVKMPRGAPKRVAQFLTWAELNALAKAAGEYETFVLVLGTTGLRIGEAAALRVGDVDVKRSRLRVNTSKSGKTREVSVAPKLLSRIDLKRAKSDPLFTSPDGHKVNVQNWRLRVFEPAAKSVGRPELRPHDLRHTAASLMIQAGRTVLDVQNTLGHASAAMTLGLYSHWFSDGLDDIGKGFDRLLTNAKAGKNVA